MFRKLKNVKLYKKTAVTLPPFICDPLALAPPPEGGVGDWRQQPGARPLQLDIREAVSTSAAEAGSVYVVNESAATGRCFS